MKKKIIFLILFMMLFLPRCILAYTATYDKQVYVGETGSLSSLGGYNCKVVSSQDGGELEFSPKGFWDANNCKYKAKKEGKVVVEVKNSENIFTYNITILKSYKGVSELDNTYQYGNVKRCEVVVSESGASHTFNTLVTVDGIKFCKALDTGELSELVCEQSGYSTFEVRFNNSGRVYGCRKKKDETKEEYIKETLYVGQKKIFSYYTSTECSIIEGDAGVFGENTILGTAGCIFTATKPGTIKLKILNKDDSTVKYYEYNVIEGNESVSQLDNRYDYGSISECKIEMVESGKRLDVTAMYNLDGIKICFDNSNSGLNLTPSKFSCEDEGYEMFSTGVKIGASSKTAFGCRKLKSITDNSGDNNNNQSDPNYSYGSCNILSPKFEQTLRDIFDLIKIAGPILALALGTLDFVKAITGGDADKELKSAFARFVKRIAAAIVLFLLPIILGFLLDTFLKNTGYDPNNPYCGIVEWDE